VLESLGSGRVSFGRAFYTHAAGELAAEPGFHDLSRITNGITEPVFFDYGHTSPIAGQPIGQAIAVVVATRRP